MRRVLADCVNCWSPLVTAGVHHVTRKHECCYVSSVTCAGAAPIPGPSHAALGGEVSCPPGRHITHQPGDSRASLRTISTGSLRSSAAVSISCHCSLSNTVTAAAGCWVWGHCAPVSSVPVVCQCASVHQVTLHPKLSWSWPWCQVARPSPAHTQHLSRLKHGPVYHSMVYHVPCTVHL